MIDLPRRLTALAAAFALVALSPGLDAYEAAAAPAFQVEAAASWRPAIAATLPLVQSGAAVSPGGVDLARVVGQLNVDLALRRVGGLTELLARMPEAYRGAPAAFTALSPDARVALLARAAQAAREDLEGEAKMLVANAGRLGEARVPRLHHLADCFYLLSPETGWEIRQAAADRREADVEAGLLAGAAALRDDRRDGRAAVSAEVSGLLDGAASLASSRTRGGERGAFARDVLEPYAESAMAAAGARLAERGIPPQTLAASVLFQHREVFGGLASPKMVRSLRKTGDWTDFVAALTIRAAQGAQPGAAETISQVSGSDYFRIAIPAWHPLASEHRTVSDWMQSWAPAAPAPEAGGVKILGIPVRLDRSFFIPLAFITYSLARGLPHALPGLTSPAYWTLGLLGAAALYSSVVAHEFGHALTGRAFGIKTRSITLHLLGGVAALEGEARSAKEEFLIAIAGPLVSAAIALGLWLAVPYLPIMAVPIARYVAGANALMVALNMIPAFPMDGGRVARSAIWAVTRDEYASTRAAGRIGMAFGALFAVLGLALLLPTRGGTIMVAFLGMWLYKAAKSQMMTPGTDRAPRRKD